MNKRDMYAFVTDVEWQDKLTSVRPHAPLCGGYRILVFSESDLPEFKLEYGYADFKYLQPNETIEHMENGGIGPFICNLSKATLVNNYFS